MLEKKDVLLREIVERTDKGPKGDKGDSGAPGPAGADVSVCMHMCVCGQTNKINAFKAVVLH